MDRRKVVCLGCYGIKKAIIRERIMWRRKVTRVIELLKALVAKG
jgi:hypothetical protein